MHRSSCGRTRHVTVSVADKSGRPVSAQARRLPLGGRAPAEDETRGDGDPFALLCARHERLDAAGRRAPHAAAQFARGLGPDDRLGVSRSARHRDTRTNKRPRGAERRSARATKGRDAGSTARPARRPTDYLLACLERPLPTRGHGAPPASSLRLRRLDEQYPQASRRVERSGIPSTSAIRHRELSDALVTVLAIAVGSTFPRASSSASTIPITRPARAGIATRTGTRPSSGWRSIAASTRSDARRGAAWPRGPAVACTR